MLKIIINKLLFISPSIMLWKGDLLIQILQNLVWCLAKSAKNKKYSHQIVSPKNWKIQSAYYLPFFQLTFRYPFANNLSNFISRGDMELKIAVIE